jgi:hypothetical protein
MFPRLRQQLLARADLLVELATLGEYGLDDEGRAMALEGDGCGFADGGETASTPLAPRTRDRCGAGFGRPEAACAARARGRAVPARS